MWSTDEGGERVSEVVRIGLRYGSGFTAFMAPHARVCGSCDATVPANETHFCEHAGPEPIVGHAGDCAKVTTATVTGKTGAACTCGKDA